MTYKLRKAPRQNKYWVITTSTGKHHSMLPLPKEEAEAHMKAMYANGGMHGGDMQGGARSTVTALAGLVASPTDTLKEMKGFFEDLAGIWNNGDVATGLRRKGKSAFTTLVKYLPLAGVPGYTAATALEQVPIDDIIELLATLVDLIGGKASLKQFFDVLAKLLGNIYEMLKSFATTLVSGVTQIAPQIGNAAVSGLTTFGNSLIRGAMDLDPGERANHEREDAERARDEQTRIQYEKQLTEEAADVNNFKNYMYKLYNGGISINDAQHKTRFQQLRTQLGKETFDMQLSKFTEIKGKLTDSNWQTFEDWIDTFIMFRREDARLHDYNTYKDPNKAAPDLTDMWNSDIGSFDSANRVAIDRPEGQISYINKLKTFQAQERIKLHKETIRQFKALKEANPQMYASILASGAEDYSLLSGSGKGGKMRGGDIGDDFRKAFDPNRNGLNESIRNTGEVLGKAFDPNKNGLAQAVNSAVDTLKNVNWNEVNSKLGDGLDPNKNGVSAAFDKFGGDAKRAFEDLGSKIRESAQRDKAALDAAFAPLANEFNNPNSALSNFARSAGIPLTPDEWKRKFEDPETYFTLLSMLVTAAASVVSAGAAGPGTFAAMQAIIASARVITKAATGQPVGAGDIAGVALAMIPGRGGVDPSSWLNAATRVGSSVGMNLVKAAAKNVVSTNVNDRLRQNGETLATLTGAAYKQGSTAAKKDDVFGNLDATNDEVDEQAVEQQQREKDIGTIGNEPQAAQTGLTPDELPEYQNYLAETTSTPENYYTPEYIDYWRQNFKGRAEGSGMRGGSMLIEHAVRYHPHKRMRENYDSRFFM